MKVVAYLAEPLGQDLDDLLFGRIRSGKEAGYLLDHNSIGTQRFGKANKLEDQWTLWVCYSAVLANLAEWLAGWTAMQETHFARAYAQRLCNTASVQSPDVHLPYSLAARVLSER